MNTYAVIQTGGKQFRVEPNQVIDVERLKVEESTKEVSLDQVLFLQKEDLLKIGSPFVRGASVLCDYLGEKKGDKVIIFKMKRRKNYRRKNGHRQLFSTLKVKEIRFQESKA